MHYGLFITCESMHVRTIHYIWIHSIYVNECICGQFYVNHCIFGPFIFNKQKITSLKLEGPYHDNTLTNKDKNNCDIITTKAMSLNPAHGDIYSIINALRAIHYMWINACEDHSLYLNPFNICEWMYMRTILCESL
jgi:hypothetical protein